MHDLGPWSAHQAAVDLLGYIQNLETKEQYERHYLLLRMTFTVLVKIHGLCVEEFKNLSELEQLMNYSTTKILRFIEIIRQFKQPGEKAPPEQIESVDVASVNPKHRVKGNRGSRRMCALRTQAEDSLCALVFVDNRFTAKLIFHLLCVS